MPGIESFGRSENEWKRRLAQIEKQVQEENRPLADIALAIITAATTCRDATKNLIQAADEKQRIEREVYIFYEFVYFFMHMTMRHAFPALTSARLAELQEYLGSIIPSVAIDSYFAHWPEDRKERMRSQFFDKLNETEMEYTESTRFDSPLEGADRISAKLQALFMKLASNVANWAVDDDKAVSVLLPVNKVALGEWKSMHLDDLIAAVKDQTNISW
jgi:hypothetical protein